MFKMTDSGMEKIPNHEKRTVCRDYRYWNSKKMLLAWYIPAGAEGHAVLHTLLGSHGADLGLAHPRLRENKTKHVALESGKHKQQVAFKDRHRGTKSWHRTHTQREPFTPKVP